MTMYRGKIEINGAGGSVTEVANPWVRRFPVSGVRFRCPAVSVARDRWHRAWPARDLDAKTLSKRCAIDGTVRGPVARDRWHRAWPAIDDDEYTLLLLLLLVVVLLLIIIIMIITRDRWHRAWPAIDGTVRGHCERFWALF